MEQSPETNGYQPNNNNIPQGQVFYPIEGSLPGTRPINYNQKAAFGLGISQMVLCVASVIIQIIFIVNATPLGGFGICCAIVSFVAGLLGMISGLPSPRIKLIVATNVMSIIAASFSAIVIFVSSIGLIEQRNFGRHSKESMTVIWQLSLMLLTAIAEGILAIFSSVLCCKAYCCCSTGGQSIMLYNPMAPQVTVSSNVQTSYQPSIMPQPGQMPMFLPHNSTYLQPPSYSANQPIGSTQDDSGSTSTTGAHLSLRGPTFSPYKRFE